MFCTVATVVEYVRRLLCHACLMTFKLKEDFGYVEFQELNKTSNVLKLVRKHVLSYCFRKQSR